LATIINNPALPPSPGLTAYPYDTYSQEADAVNVPGASGPTAQANLWLASMLQNPYDAYEIRTFLFWDEGLIGLPVAGPPGTHAEIVRRDAGRGEKAVAWFAQRDGANIQAPQQEANTATQVFAGEHFLCKSAKLMADGVTWRLTWAGYYRYLLTRRVSPNVGDSVSFGQPPYAQGSAAANVFAPSDLVGGITIPHA
jgi:hypothetical protein